MNLTEKETIFLLYFLPLFSTKILNITSDNIILKVVGLVCFCIYFLYALSKEKYNLRLFKVTIILFLFSIVTIVASGKQGFLFSIIMIMALKDVRNINLIYKICLTIGTIFFIIACIISTGTESTRYINGEWVTIYKRSNILYVAFIALVCLYLYLQKNKKSKRHIIVILIPAYLAYLYIGSRTGILLIYFLIFLLFILRINRIKQNKLIKFFCCFSPLICMSFSIYSGMAFENSPFLPYLDILLQGRLYQNSLYLNEYNIPLFGQPISEGIINGEYRLLDCAYIDMLLCQGLIFSILWIICTTIVIKYMYEQNRMTEVAILVMYAFYGISETFLSNCFLNMSFFLYAEYMYSIFQHSTNSTYKNKSCSQHL